MSYIHLDKSNLVNLEYSLFKEVLRTNRSGSYSSSSIIGCNTRKYHGLLVSPLKQFNGELYVMLSSLDVSVIQHEQAFNLGIHKYHGSHYEPKGHKYIRDFEMDPIPKLIYRVGEVVLSVEHLLAEKEAQVLIRITLEDAHSPTLLRLKPFLAFRHIHELMHANLYANTKYKKVPNGLSLSLYEGFPELNMQLSKEGDFVPVPDWNFGIEYIKEENRGYEFKEDLYVPGYFDVSIEKGESIVFSGSLAEANPSELKTKFIREADKRVPRNSLFNNMLNAAQQFLQTNGKESSLLAGYHWYGARLRDTLIALPGLTIYQGEKGVFKEILVSAIKKIEREYLTDDCTSLKKLKEVDTLLWLFWTLQECVCYTEKTEVWNRYGDLLKKILNCFCSSKTENLKLTSQGLVYAKLQGIPVTWMDALVDAQPVTSRYGLAVEVNALWYNAIVFSVEQARIAGDNDFVKEWEPMIEKVKVGFLDVFWNNEGGYLYDCVDEEKDSSIRPNQLIAASLANSPLSIEQRKSVIDIVKKELLTPKGIRSLSPQDPKYKGVVEGTVRSRDLALHQGTVFPWLVSFFAEGYLRLHKKGGLPIIKRLLDGFEAEMNEHCLGTISECYNGNPPHKGKGAVSMAWNVAAVLKVFKIIEQYS
ncbi:glycogen debranching protein [Marinilabiliaceae bacterium JC017]|nr:glycogen debranching protein [Marinilabiliaceae bacterium JC017]